MADSANDATKWVYDLAACLGTDRYSKFIGLPNRKYAEIKAPVTQQVIAAHLRSSPAIAAPILCSDDKGRVIVADFDDHRGLLPPGEMEQHVIAFAQMLRQRAISHIIVRSGSGTGYHIWIIFSRAMRKDRLRDSSKRLLATFSSEHPELALTEGTAGVPGGQLELFPKGDGKGAGGMIALPLARKSRRVALAEGADGQTVLIDWPEPFDKLPINEPRKPGPKGGSVATAKPDPDAAFDAYVSPLDPNDYDHWCKEAVPHLKGAFGSHSEWAYGRWKGFSKRASNPADDETLQRKWDSFDKVRCGETKFWLVARERGYTGPLPFSKRDERRAELEELTDQLELLHGDDGIAYAKVAGLPIAMPIDSQAMRDWIRLAAREAGGSIKKDEVGELVEIAGAVARSKPRTQIALRFGRHDGAIYVCHADREQNVTKIDRSGFHLCTDPPLTFRRGRGEPLHLAVPAKSDVLLEMLNVDRANLVVIVSFMLNALMYPGGHSPLLMINGPPGSGKSSVTKAIVRMLDPKIGAQAGPPKNEDDLIAVAHGSAILTFDNARTANHLSDALCRLATGGGIAKRALFTNADLFSLNACRPVLINGVDTLVSEQDLAARTVTVTLRRPLYGSDKDYMEALDARLPEMTGAVFGLASKVLGMIDAVEIGDPNLRFYDFTRIGECVATLLGFDAGWFIETYRAMLGDSGLAALEANPIARFVIMLCAQQGRGESIEASATEFLTKMVDFARNGLITVSPQDMPPNPRSFASRLNAIRDDLEQHIGIRVRDGKRTASFKPIRFEWDGVDMRAVDELFSRLDTF